MRAKVTKTFRFEASHHLPDHDGKCRNPHGHSYRAVITCEGRVEDRPDHPKRGMVIDFADIKAVWKRDIEPLIDHQDLNVTLSQFMSTTTAECIAWWLWKCFDKRGIPVGSVEVWETETSSALVTARDVLNGH